MVSAVLQKLQLQVLYNPVLKAHLVTVMIVSTTKFSIVLVLYNFLQLIPTPFVRALRALLKDHGQPALFSMPSN